MFCCEIHLWIIVRGRRKLMYVKMWLQQIHRACLDPQHVVYQISWWRCFCLCWFWTSRAFHFFSGSCWIFCLQHWLTEQRRHFTVSSVNVQYQYAAERFVSGPSGSPYQSSPSCCCQLGEQKVLSSGLQEGDITTTGCNENPLHGTAGQSERSLSREQDDVNQSGPPPRRWGTA